MEQILIVLAVIWLVFVVAFAAAVFLVVRGARRRYRAWRARLLAPRDAQHDGRGLLRASGSIASSTIGSPSWWAAQNQRHRVWRAVTSAEHAVGVAKRAE